MRTLPLAALGLMAMVLMLAACGGASPGTPALPPGFLDSGVPDVPLNGYAYVATGDTMTLRAGALGTRSDGPAIAVSVVEAALRDPAGRWASQLELVGTESAGIASALVPDDTDETAFMALEDQTLVIGRSDDDWGDRLREAWRNEERVTLEERYPEAWESLQLLPSSPPCDPVAVGFARNVADLFDQLLRTGEVSTPSLSYALGLVRVDWIAFAGYSDDLGPLPDAGRRDLLRDLDAGVIFVAQAGYPSVVVDTVFAQFVEAVNLAEVEVGESTAHYRSLHDGLHLFVKNYGPSFFFVAGPSRESAGRLMEAVVSDQLRR
jgi:hypothetical protein